jgi:hypothetical protein
MTMDVYGHLIIDKVRQLTRRASHRTLADLLSDLFGVAMAAAFHDVARQDEGEDLWDDERAQMFSSWTTSLGVPPFASRFCGTLWPARILGVKRSS